jgi:hypothetical protein
MKFKKTATGFAFAVVTPAVLNSALLLGYMLINSFSNYFVTDLGGALAAFALIALAVGLVTSFVGCVVFGIPVYFILQRCRLYSWPVYAVAGFATGLLMGVLMPLVMRSAGMFDAGTKGLFVLFCLSGAVAALTFWWVVRPDMRLTGVPV